MRNAECGMRNARARTGSRDLGNHGYLRELPIVPTVVSGLFLPKMQFWIFESLAWENS